MLRPHSPRRTRRVRLWPGVLLACLLSVLLLAAVHCSSYLATDDHRHLSLSAPATPDGPQHEHGSACVSPCLTTWTSTSESQGPAFTPGAPPSAEADALPVVQAAPAAFRSGRQPIARTGRSTLADVCRWRI
ncbi:hypothetical protein [Streptomyces nojiriensis]|uniref:hypothetical protein n=1 Tax=Streptomyces nojiriensis TaxID=66374 RepID=UPI0035DA124C